MSANNRKVDESGAALIVSLILLLVLTLLGLSSVRTVAVEERITANTFDRSLGFQGAEAALREGEAAAVIDAGAPAFSQTDVSCTCKNAICSPPAEGCLDRASMIFECKEADKSDCGPWTNAGVELEGHADTPQYFVEYLGDGFPCNIDAPDTGLQECKRYQVTARSGSTPGRAQVILQTIYATIE